MFVLLLIVTAFVIPFPNPEVSVTPIITFSTLKECEDERIRITSEFDRAYPEEERNYTLECKPVRRNHV